MKKLTHLFAITLSISIISGCSNNEFKNTKESQKMKTVLNNSEERVLTFDFDKVQKDLKDSIQGVDAESHATGVNYKILLNDLRDDFSKLLKDSGRPVLRMADMSRRSWKSPEINDILRTARYNRPSRNSKDYWFSPAEFHKFCKENKIRLIGFFDANYAYDDKTGKGVKIIDSPENFEIAVRENIKKLKWVIDNGYLDLYVAWEIGNESYGPWKKPELFAEYALMMAKAAKKLDPEIRLGIPVVVCAPDDPNLLKYTGDGKARMDKWYRWSESMLKTLGDNLDKFYYLNIHLYGASLRYNANYKGILTHHSLLKKFPSAKHMRFIVTEWRHTGVADQHHRIFKVGLWKAKFTLVLAAHPIVDYTGVHDFLTWSGVGYYSDGKVWFRQGTAKAPKKSEMYKCKTGKPSLDAGIFAPVLKMTNHIIRNYPLLLVHKADLGNNSSGLFVSARKDDNSSKSMDKLGRDLEWFICTDRAKNKIGAILVNTQSFPVNIELKDEKGKQWSVKKAEALTCPLERIFETEIPGEKKFWKLAPMNINPDGTVAVPPLSVVSVETN